MKPKRKKLRVERVAWLEDGALRWERHYAESVEFYPPVCSFAREIQEKLKPSRTKKIRLVAEEL